MDDLYSNSYALVTFKQVYDVNIKPKLEAIDLFFKTEKSPYTPEQIATLFQLSLDEVLDIMGTHDIKELSKLTSFTIIMHASSHICNLIRRQAHFIGSTYYTPSIISFIYEINEAKVHNAFNHLGKEVVLEHELSDVFERIPVPLFRF